VDPEDRTGVPRGSRVATGRASPRPRRAGGHRRGPRGGDRGATGLTLFTLQRIGFPTDHPVYQRGVAFLLETQREDGSWLVETRSKPVQVFFDNGDPHGKSQFISIPATSWATTALALALPAPREARF
jgi:hypothetical protein